MDYSIQPNIDKEYILSRVSEEQIMSFYLNIPVKKGVIHSPLRKDSHASCSFYRNSKGVLLFKDFATGDCLNCFEVVKRLFSCDFYEALRIIANDFGLYTYNHLQRHSGKIYKRIDRIENDVDTRIDVQVKEFTDDELKWWDGYGISLAVLKKFRVYSLEYVWVNGRIVAKSQPSCPVYGYYGRKKDSKDLWKIYFPKRKEYRFLGNYPASKVQGYEQLPSNGDILVITKSMKDVMCLYTFGVHAIAPGSEVLFVSDTMLNNLRNRFRVIVVFYDNDIPGIHNMRKIRASHPDLTYIWIPRRLGAKDFSDLYLKVKRQKMEKLVQWAKQKLQSV